MENNLINLLVELESLLKASNYLIVTKFNDGKEEKEIAEYLHNLKFSARKDFVDLYKWKNGVSNLFQGGNIGQLELFANGIMLPLEYAISTYTLEVKVQKKFNSYFFPIFTSGGGDYILINFNTKSKLFGQLFLYSPSLLMTNAPMSIYDSLEVLFETILSIYKEKGYSFKNNVLEVDYEIESLISRRLNPKSDFWKED